MNVYVESNFVLEEALEQEQCESCKELIRMASIGAIRLVIPADGLSTSLRSDPGATPYRVNGPNPPQDVVAT
jgi:hypothetical protein